MARFFYSVILYLLSPLILLHLWLRGNKAPEYRKRWHERFGFIASNNIKKNAIIFHCASVGEVVAATPLIKKVQLTYPNSPIIITCNSPTGTEQIKRSFSGTVEHVYLPLDFPCATRRFIKNLKPKMICILETELWPNLIAQSKKQNIPVILLNARLSEKSLAGYKKIAPLSQSMMQGITQLAAHDQNDAARFIELGLDKHKVVTTGSIKFDIKISQNISEKVSRIKQQLIQKHPIWIAGSTHPGENELLLKTHQALLKSYPNALLILVPRHPEQFDKVADLISSANLSFQRKSSLSDSCTSQVLLSDTMGELGILYGAAQCAFIGGSLIERGGHNPLEASAYGIPVITGPHILNFLHVYPELLKAQGCLKVDSSEQIITLLQQIFSDESYGENLGRKGALFVQKNQGAIKKTIEVIARHLK
ncbi:3-deoxy-D-manno-octulosonic acid transferase [Pseudoalteromonas sp. NBT06-2]|uniref:lipid IV(A) 3-deoxy-D-manno-octulosonic acid transferase n=1 Tax=Pseudoalteromonas sp. NBT06-2 TaxID=2025950 RepID=UPI000BA69AC2|nr:lipid IV(A) 3-deoxy-D-manno-octulosonic acid transferase [Pseudoalteromonas sp. NBT06-2]PAJ74269.1 3-deoxy-D-manno-octulosonic acid transferase [Pseudoalteromonas sp. NBT06-2]